MASQANTLIDDYYFEAYEVLEVHTRTSWSLPNSMLKVLTMYLQLTLT